MYNCSAKWQADYISESDFKTYASQLAASIEPSSYGPENIDLNSGIHLTGGEPFLKFDLLLRCAEILNQIGLPSTFVETNAFWCKNDETTEDKLMQLKQAGLKGIMISVNPFVLEHVPFKNTERVARLSRRVFGQNAVVYQQHFYSQFKKLNIESTLPFLDYLKMAGTKSLYYAEVIPMGRLCYTMGNLFQKRKAEYFFGFSCKDRLTSPHHIHIDNYGNYMTGFCGGISLGDAHNMENIFAGIDLEQKPVLKALAKDIEHLYRLAKSLDYHQLSDGYISPCHLCMDIRKHLVEKTDEFEELKPQQIYKHI
jgi:hypothetical protein